MNQEYLNRLEEIRDALEEIQILRDDLADLIKNPAVSLEQLEEVRDVLEEIQLNRDCLKEE